MTNPKAPLPFEERANAFKEAVKVLVQQHHCMFKAQLGGDENQGIIPILKIMDTLPPQGMPVTTQDQAPNRAARRKKK